MHSEPSYPKMYLYRRVVQAKLFIDEHFASAIGVGNIADEAYFSKFHFIKLFKSIYGKTPHQYLVHVRIEKAMQLLKGAMPVADVCYAVGFESVTSFCGLFKRRAGITPYQYLTQCQQVKQQAAASPLTFIPGCFAEKNGWKEKVAAL